METNVKRYPVYTVFASNLKSPKGDYLVEKALHCFATEKEAEESIKNGFYDVWLMQDERPRLFVQKCWTLEKFITSSVLAKLKEQSE